MSQRIYSLFHYIMAAAFEQTTQLKERPPSVFHGELSEDLEALINGNTYDTAI